MSRVAELTPDLSRAAVVLMRDMMCVVESEHVLVTADACDRLPALFVEVFCLAEALASTGSSGEA